MNRIKDINQECGINHARTYWLGKNENLPLENIIVNTNIDNDYYCFRKKSSVHDTHSCDCKKINEEQDTDPNCECNGNSLNDEGKIGMNCREWLRNDPKPWCYVNENCKTAQKTIDKGDNTWSFCPPASNS